MKNKKPPKRYNIRASILAAIDATHNQLDLSVKAVEAYTIEIDAIKAWFGVHPNVAGMNEDALSMWHGKLGRLKLCKEECGVRARSIPRHHNTLRGLKLLIAEFDTEPMAFLENGSVVVR